jgi:ferredoxin/coenzyme F420-reducing hydrogenase delta subunit
MPDLLKLEMGQRPGNGARSVAHAASQTLDVRDQPFIEFVAKPPPGQTVWGQRILRWLESGFSYVDHLLYRFLPPVFNPLGQIGAIANTCFVAALLSGIALLLWYSPSVHQAYSSLEIIRQSSWLGQWVRSLHRYSSDACVFLILLHALRMFLSRRFIGPRWLAWLTGIVLLAVVWFIGWTGYWLVWDVRAQHVALGTAKFLDQFPIATEPLARSFLTDQSVHSLLFFLVFFAHMLAPLAVGIGLWIHLMRVNRAKLFPRWQMIVWVTGSLAVLSALLPATSAVPAHMTVKVPRFTIDWWFLWPLGLTDRLGGRMLWGIFALAGMAVGSIPWWLAKRRLTLDRKATVDLSRCFGCTLCSQDCPFNAITMVPREDGRNFPVQSLVDPALCIGCGVCVGACDSQAINLPWLESREYGRHLKTWIETEIAQGKRPFVAFVCNEVTGSDLRIDPQGRSPDLPGYLVCPIPCVGWLSAELLERALQDGAGGVLIIGCGSSDPTCREGAKWLQQRLDGEREPKLNPKKADRALVNFVKFDRSSRGEFRQMARNFQQGVRAISPTSSCKPSLRWAVALALAVGLAAVTVSLSCLPYRSPLSTQPELVVSFMHRGEARQERPPTKEELAKRLPHMRAQVNLSRERVPVGLRVTIDGTTVLQHAYKPKGISADGPSMALEHLPISEGVHIVEVQIADTSDPDKWTYQWREQVEFKAQQTRVLLFETKSGFTLN